MLDILPFKDLRRKLESTPRQQWSKNGKYVLVFNDLSSKKGFNQNFSLMELYMNLVFVALLTNLTSIFNVCGNNFTSFRRAFEEFLIFYNFRMHLSEFSCRFFASKNKLNRFLHVMGTLGLFIMACFSQAQQDKSSSDNANVCSLDDDLLYGYVSGFLIARISLILLYCTATAFNYRARIQFSYSMWLQMFVIAYVVIAFLYFGIGSIDESSIYISYMFVVPSLVELVCRMIQPFVRPFLHTPGALYNFYPINVFDIQYRLHEYILIIIGEAFVSLISVSPVNGSRGRIFIFLVCSFILLCSMGRIYRGVVDRNGKEHALHRSKSAGVVWLTMHMLTGYALFIVSCALKRCYQQIVNDQPIYQADSKSLSISCAVSVIGCSILRALHKGVIGMPISVRKEKRRTRFIVYSFHVLTAVSHGLVAFTSQATLESNANDNIDYIIIIHTVVSCFFNIAERVATHYSRSMEERAIITSNLSIVSASHDEVGFINPVRVLYLNNDVRYDDESDNERESKIEEKEGGEEEDDGIDEENRDTHSRVSRHSSWKLNTRPSDISDLDANTTFLVTAEDRERFVSSDFQGEKRTISSIGNSSNYSHERSSSFVNDDKKGEMLNETERNYKQESNIISSNSNSSARHGMLEALIPS